jgi:MFS transporter, DHA3 family, macrolide efflux protein
VLRDPNVRRVVLARFISRSGGEAAFFVGIWGKAAFELGADATALAWIIAATGVSGLIGSAIAGTLIDRFGPKRVLLTGEIVFVPVALSMLLVESLGQLTAVAFLIGLVSGPLYTSIASLPPFLTADPEELSRVNGWVETAGMAALISGTAAGAALASLVSLDAIFVFDAATSIVAVALVAGITIRHVERTTDRRGGLDQLREGFRFAYAHPRLRFYVLIGTSVWLLFGLFGALEPLFFRDVLGTGPEAIGWVNSIFGVGLVLGTLLAPRLPPAARGARGVVTLVALNGLGAILYVGTALIPVVALGGFTWGIIIGTFAPIVRTLIHLNSPEALYGRITGTVGVHAEAAKLLPLVAAPAMAVAFGVQTTLAASGLMLTVLGMATWRTAARLDATRPVPLPPVEAPAVWDEPISPTP